METLEKFQGGDYTTGCLLDYSYFKENFRMTAIDLSKKQVLDTDPSNSTSHFYWKFRSSSRYIYVLHSCRSKWNCFGRSTRISKSLMNVLYNNLIWFNIKNNSIQYFKWNLIDDNNYQKKKEKETKLVLRLSSNIIDNSDDDDDDDDDDVNFPQKLLLTNRVNCRQALANHLSVGIKLWKSQLSKMIQLRVFLRRLLGPLLTTGLPLMYFNH